MQQPNKIAAYLETVRQQIRWKKAQPPVLEELENHLTDQKNAYINDGLDEETAVNKAVAEMGDPVVVGEQLDRTHRPRPDWPLLIMTAVLLILGLSIQFLIRSDIHNGTESFTKQVIWAAPAIIVLIIAYLLDFTIIGKYPKTIYLALVVVTVASYWSYRYVIGSSAIYPLLLFPTAFAGLVYSMRNKEYGGLIICGATVIVPVLLALLIHNMTILLMVGLSCLIILTVAIAKGWFNVSKLMALLILYLSTGIISLILFLTLMSQAYFRVILQHVLSPQGPTGSVGTVIRSFLYHSRFVGEGSPVSGYGSVFPILSAANTNFLLTYLTYKFGWILFMGIMLLFAAFLVRSIIISQRQKSVLRQLVSLAVILTVAMEIFTYIIANLGFLLFGQISLPLISYGGRALVTNMCLIGLLLSTFRTGNLFKDNVPVGKSNRLVQYKNGKIIINLRANS